MGPSGSRFDPKKKMLMTPGAIQNLCKQQGKHEGTVSSSPTYCVCVSSMNPSTPVVMPFLSTTIHVMRRRFWFIHGF